VLVEVLAAPVVDGRSRVGVEGSDLDLAKRDAGVEGGHYEGGPEHVRTDQSDRGSRADRAHCLVTGGPQSGIGLDSFRLAVDAADVGSLPGVGPVTSTTAVDGKAVQPCRAASTEVSFVDD
jgi:hypothetical protein